MTLSIYYRIERPQSPAWATQPHLPRRSTIELKERLLLHQAPDEPFILSIYYRIESSLNCFTLLSLSLGSRRSTIELKVYLVIIMVPTLVFGQSIYYRIERTSYTTGGFSVRLGRSTIELKAPFTINLLQGYLSVSIYYRIERLREPSSYRFTRIYSRRSTIELKVFVGDGVNGPY